MIGAIIKKYWKLLLSLAITVSLGFALIAGLTSGYQSLKHSLEQYISEYHYPDAQISTEVTSVSDAEKLLGIKGVTGCDTRLCANSMLKTTGGDYYSVRVFSYRDEGKQRFYFWERIDAEGQDSVLLEYHFADSHNIKAGDFVSFRIRDEYRSFLVEGIISRPETLYAKISDRVWGINYDFSYVYASIDLLSKEYEKDSAKVRDELKEKEEKLADELGKAQTTLQEKEGELNNAKELLANSQALFSDKEKEADAGKTELQRTRKELRSSLHSLTKQRKSLHTLSKNTEQKKKDLTAQKKQLLEAKSGLAQIDAALAQLEQAKAVINQIEESGVIFYLLLLPQDAPLSEIIQSLEEQYEIDPSQPPDPGSIPEGIPIPDTFPLPETKEELESLIDTVRGIAEDFFPGRTLESLTISEILTRYDSFLSECAENELMLDGQRLSILSQLDANGIREDGIDAALQQLDEGIKACDSGLTQIQKGTAQIANGIGQIKTGIVTIDQKLQEIDGQLAQARQELSGAESEIQSAETELNQRTAEAMKEFSNMEEELDEAYKELDENEGYDRLCNQFLLYLDPDADPEAILTQAEDILSKDLSITNSYTYAESPVKDRIDKNLNPLYTLAVYCPVVFYIVTLGIIFLFMSMILKQSRREIGILRALGFSRSRIRGIFCLISLLVALCGILIGTALAYGILRYVGHYFQDFFPLPFFRYEVDLWMCLAGAAVAALICLIATLITTGTISRIVPKEAMSRPVLSKVSIPAWIRSLTKRMKPINKFSLTSLLRGKGRFLFATICTAVTIMLIFSSISFIAAKNHVIEQTFTQRIHYDCQIFFEEAPDQELLEKLRSLDYVSDVQPLLYYETEFPSGEEAKPAILYAVEPDTSLISIYDTGGNLLSAKEGEIILERHLAKELQVKEGDMITVNGAQMRIGAISDQCANYTHYIALSDAERIGTPDLGCVICNIPEDKYSSLLAYLTENETDGYLYTIFTPPFFLYNTELYNTYDTGAWMLILFSVIIGFVIILNTMMTNLEELKHELCVLRSLGFSRGEISKSRFGQTILQFLIASPVGLAAGYFFAKTVLLQMGSKAEDYAFSSGVKEYAFSVLIVFAYLLISHLLAMRKLKTWNISENVKDKE